MTFINNPKCAGFCGSYRTRFGIGTNPKSTVDNPVISPVFSSAFTAVAGSVSAVDESDCPSRRLGRSSDGMRGRGTGSTDAKRVRGHVELKVRAQKIGYSYSSMSHSQVRRTDPSLKYLVCLVSGLPSTPLPIRKPLHLCPVLDRVTEGPLRRGTELLRALY